MNKIEPRKMKVAELRAQLQAGNLKSTEMLILVQRLRGALETEAAEETEGEAAEETEGEAAEETEGEAAEETEGKAAEKTEGEAAEESEASEEEQETDPEEEEEVEEEQDVKFVIAEIEEEEDELLVKKELQGEVVEEDETFEGHAEAWVKEVLMEEIKYEYDNVESIDIKEEPIEVKVEATEEWRRGEKRAVEVTKMTPVAKRSRPDVEDKYEFDKSLVVLDRYNSDTSLIISEEDRLSAYPLTGRDYGSVWHGVRATYGFTKGKVFYEVEVMEHPNVPHLKADEDPHVIRVGWSVDDTGLMLGEEPLSYGYEGTAKASSNLRFKNYGIKFGKGDVVGCFLNLDVQPAVISFTVNGEHQGIAYKICQRKIGDAALFPHIVTKNSSFQVNFGQEDPWFKPVTGYTALQKVPLEERVLATQGPEKRKDCETTSKIAECHDTEEFISEVGKRPARWDRSNKQYKNKKAKVCCSVSLDYEEKNAKEKLIAGMHLSKFYRKKSSPTPKGVKGFVIRGEPQSDSDVSDISVDDIEDEYYPSQDDSEVLRQDLMIDYQDMGSEYLKIFSNLDDEEKRQIIENGRPTPELMELKQQKGTEIIRTFQTAWYSKKEWLCGCNVTKRLFCFPCLLFSVSSESVWVKEGYCDLDNLPNALSKHEQSAAHYESQISLKTFGSAQVDLLSNKQKSFSIELHNKKVKENRDILKKIICATYFVIKQELAFCGDKQKSSLNSGNYIELLNYTAKFDENLAQQLQNSSFSRLSNRIQNDLIEAVGTMVENHIKEEIAQAPFIAIEVDEMTDISCTAQCSTILRYMLDSDIKEVFIGFDILKDRTVGSVTECIFSNLDKYNCGEKLVAQTYDGAVIMASHLNGVQLKVREKSPAALFTHCYAHELNVVLSQSAKFIPECTSFFMTTEALASFFNHSTKPMQFLDEIVRKLTPEAEPVRWSSNSKLIQTIFQYHGHLCKLFKTINNNPLLSDPDTLVRSSGFYDWLTKDSTYFFLMVYNEIFIKTDTLFDVLQTKIIDVPYYIERINGTINLLEDLQKNFEYLYVKFEEYCWENNLTESKSCTKGSIKKERIRIFGIILDNILENIKARFNLENFKFISLVDRNNFKKFACQVDKDAFQSLEKNYGNFFDIVRLKADLAGIYNAPVFRGKSVKDLLDFLFVNELTQTFPEAVKLMQLVLTIPATTVLVERSFSTLKRIESYTRNRKTNQRLSSLALISIEKERLNKMEQDPTFNFYEKVTDIFATKKERMDFLYM
ncbi:uncharacterized protein LOC143021925 isoform X3 [Oratosquilla oratoria]|uniref:uncharacterized protein LOC143021925 isoform X3 n=1 Tax=Oratosquilla oratoria TaxID=337810 RepID=UPI003F75A515